MGLGLFSCTLTISYWPFQSWIWVIKVHFSFSNFIWTTTRYSLSSWHVCSKPIMVLYCYILNSSIFVVPRHLFKINLEMFQIIVSFLIELIEFNIFIL
jgi:hypothetical protein